MIKKNIIYLFIGSLMGILFTKAEIISWFRINEMFYLDSFFMYGVIGTAVIVGMISVQLIKRFKLKAFNGEKITIENKTFNKGQIYGGLIFGIGWAITGSCPGPIFIQLGNGFMVVFITILSATAGTWVYGLLKNKLPH